MSDLSTNLEPAETFEVSTQLDEGRTTEGQPAKEPEEKPKPESRLDAIKRAADDLKIPDDKVDDKPAEKVEAKPAEVKAETENPADDTKPADAERPAQQPEQPADKQRRQHIEAPANFMPRAKELWQNTPHEVRADMQRVISEAQAETAQARESSREYEAVRPFAEMAKQSGTTIDQALSRYVGMEQTFRSDPTRGFKVLLANMQMSPTQAIGHVMAAFGVSPERVAAHMQQAPNDYTALAPQQRQQAQQQPNSEVEALKQQIAQMQQGLAHRDVESTIIAPFAAENPRYYELEPTIAHFLRSDIVPKSLSPHDRLAAAYDMAVRISPSVKQPAPSDPTESLGEKEDSRAGEDFGGTKSVRGAPASGVDTSNPRRGKMSRGDALKAAFAAAGVAH